MYTYCTVLYLRTVQYATYGDYYMYTGATVHLATPFYK